MKWIMILLGLLIIASVAGIIYVRSVGHDPDHWHVDPAKVTQVNGSNEYLGSETFAADPSIIGAALTSALGGEVIAGDLSDGWATFVVRTPLVGYPDYVSVRVVPVEAGTQVIVYSRSRFGKSDLGANKTRVESLFSSLKDSSSS